MNKLITALIIATLLLFANSCKKDEPIPPDNSGGQLDNDSIALDNDSLSGDTADVYFTDLHDTTVATWMSVSSDMSTFDLSLDKDSVTDLYIEVRTHWSPAYGSKYTIQLTPQNGYEMAFDSLSYSTWSFTPSSPDTVYGYYTIPVPQAMAQSEIISNQLKFSGQSRYLSYYESFGVSSGGSSSGHYYRVPALSYIYLAFRKETNDQPVWAWLKLKYNGTDQKYGVILNSCKYSNPSDSLEIE